MNIVIVGHVDHGKSTLIGRLLVDTNTLPEGKLEQVKYNCEKNAKPFEYAFLLDTLEDEQAQGITIDTARIFFKTEKREYIIIDAPGHIEFLKNMISGAARADAAVLLIDAGEGIAENSKRHAFMLSLLGINQVIVVVNKMDLVGYHQKQFDNITKNFSDFLKTINIKPLMYIPVSARNGDNLVRKSNEMKWYADKTFVEALDFLVTEKKDIEKPLRMFVQGVYKFNGHLNGRRIIVGSINSGKIRKGDRILFYPSGRQNCVRSVEVFNEERTEAVSGEAIGLTLTEEIYLKNNELIVKEDQQLPKTSDRFRANIFWVGKSSLQTNKEYKIKIGTLRTKLCVESIENVMNTSDIKNLGSKELVEKNEVAQCILKTSDKISFDRIVENKATSRFVIIDDYDIVGGGIIIEELAARVKRQISFAELEKELQVVINKYFPHWEIKTLTE